MGMECVQSSNAVGTEDCGRCMAGGWDYDTNTADPDNYAVDENGYCGVDDTEFPGDLCGSYQPDLSGEYCDRCGEYLGYDEVDEDDCDYEESECRCND